MNEIHPGIGFTRWLRLQRDRQDPVGQLGRFVADDPCWVASKYRSVAIYHLREQHGEGEEMVGVVMQAWREFREFKKARAEADQLECRSARHQPPRT